MNLNAHLHLAQNRANELVQEAQRDRVVREARAFRPAAPDGRPALNVRALLVRLHLT